MKRQIYDYSGFRLSKLTDPRFSHILLLGGWIFYFAGYLLTENLIPVEKCHPVHCALDDIIPFNEFFIIPYVFWYVLIVASLLYFLLYDVKSFAYLQKYIIITQVVAIAIYVIYPTRQDLRPDTFARDNILTDLIRYIYSVDTSTGVCPSLHCAYSIGIASVWVKAKDIHPGIKAASVFLAALICVSTWFVKQHSVVDFFAAIPLCVLAELLVFWKSRYSVYFKRKRGRNPGEDKTSV